MLELNAVHQGDCLELMSGIPDGSVDMILCDLPYGTTACKWDTVIPFEPLWAHYRRVVKPNAPIVLFAQQPFTAALVTSNLDWFKYCWVWDKQIPRLFQVAKYRPMSQHEDIAVFGAGRVTYNPQMTLREKPISYRNYGSSETLTTNLKDVAGLRRISTHRHPNTIIRGFWQAQRGKQHPTQKPVALCEYLIKTYSNEGAVVLDNCAGSGTVGVACQNTKRNFILIEREQKYVEICKSRLTPQPQ